jgi:hypothetical protein
MLKNLLVSFFILLSLKGFSQEKSIILGRPTDTTMTASILFDQVQQFYLEYGTQSGVFPFTTPTVTSVANVPDEVVIRNLSGNTRYYYRLRYRTGNTGPFAATPQYNFMTQRAPGSTFRFNLEADEHLYDKKGIRNMYKVCLANQAKDSADFMMSLGDIFGDDHTPDLTTSADMDALHKDYLQYLKEVCHSVPFYVCLGNHEGENGFYLQQNNGQNIAVYGTQWRKYYYPNPYPNGFYTGNTTNEPFGIGMPENYFAWTWGDALFVVLDVYRDCSINAKPQNWDWTLGFTQYTWLKNTLQNSNAKFKFVFAHHTRGQGRGGIITAKGCEWGGYSGNAGTNYQFDTYRPGWGLPIHQLMVANDVNIFFQGHDHLYAKEVLDSLVYQEVPMPSDSTYEIGWLANADAYTDVKLPGTGHIRVTVTPTCATVDFVRAWLPADTLLPDSNGVVHHNGEIAYSYTVGPCTNTATSKLTGENFLNIYPNPARDMLNIRSKRPFGKATTLDLYDPFGRPVRRMDVSAGESTGSLSLQGLAPGTYALRWLDEKDGLRVKMVVVQ